MRRFIGDASHELRTPLVTVRGYAELYRMGAICGDDDVAQAMDRIEKEATRMGVLVEDLLALARLDERRDLIIAPSTCARSPGMPRSTSARPLRSAGHGVRHDASGSPPPAPARRRRVRPSVAAAADPRRRRSRGRGGRAVAAAPQATTRSRGAGLRQRTRCSR